VIETQNAKTCPETELLYGAQCPQQVYQFGVGAYVFHGCSVRGTGYGKAAR
jgi:hypothetical protein